MAKRDVTQGEVLFSGVPGDAKKVRAVLADWGVEESSIRRLLREHGAEPADVRGRIKPAPPAPARHN